MKLVVGAITFACALSLVGCVGPFTSKTCGLENAKWERMSPDEQVDFAKAYHEKQRLAEQLKINKMHAKYQKKLAKQLKKNQRAETRRLKQERVAIMKQQAKIEAEMLRQQEAALNSQPIAQEPNPVIELNVDLVQNSEQVAD